MQTDVASNHDQICTDILRVLLPHRRTENAQCHPADEYLGCFFHQLNQIHRFVSGDLPITFTLPAFPCKSPNTDKVLGHLPDLGELASLRFLNHLCAQVGEMYSPGARVLICSDGHVFADLIRVPDQHIDEYAAALRGMINEEGLSTIELFSLADVYGNIDYPDKRELLTKEYAQSLESLRAEVRTDEATLRLYRGITRFLMEDSYDPSYTGSRRSLLKECRERAYGVIQRSRAWSDLVAEHHKDSVRLSIHPQPCGSEKLGIALLNIDNPWTTPWHSVAVVKPDNADQVTLMKRSDAEQIGRMVFVGGRPSHYVADE